MKPVHTRICLALILTLCYGICLAQPNYKKGFIVNTNGDTLSGFINYKEWYKTPRSFSFKLSADDSRTETYGLNNLTFLQVEGRVTYEKFAKDAWLAARQKGQSHE